MGGGEEERYTGVSVRSSISTKVKPDCPRPISCASIIMMKCHPHVKSHEWLVTLDQPYFDRLLLDVAVGKKGKDRIKRSATVWQRLTDCECNSYLCGRGPDEVHYTRQASSE